MIQNRWDDCFRICNLKVATTIASYLFIKQQHLLSRYFLFIYFQLWSFKLTSMSEARYSECIVFQIIFDSTCTLSVNTYRRNYVTGRKEFNLITTFILKEEYVKFKSWEIRYLSKFCISKHQKRCSNVSLRVSILKLSVVL